MALGGGTWAAQNKTLPGTYINFTSAKNADASLSERGIVAAPLTVSWGPENEVITLHADTVAGDCFKLFGYTYADPKMAALRELFCHARTILAYRITQDGVKASCTYATAKYTGARGNDLRIVIAANADVTSNFDVLTYLGAKCVDTQTVAAATDLIANDFVVFDAEATLAATTGTALTGGSDGSGVTGESFVNFLTAMESRSFNILVCPSADSDVINTFIAYTKRAVTENGANFQLVCHKPTAADSEYVIGVENTVSGNLPAYGLVYWAAGAQAACALGASVTNMEYDGELTVNTAYSQATLATALEEGKFVLHDVNGTVRVLEDINTLVTTGADKSEDFQSNQVMRFCADAANRIAQVFNTRYLGVIQNDANGRISLWNDICKVFQSYEKDRVITDFDTGTVEVLPGDTKKSVVCKIGALTVINAMGALYLNIVIA